MHDMEEVLKDTPGRHTLECPGRKQLNFDGNRFDFMGIEVNLHFQIKVFAECCK